MSGDSFHPDRISLSSRYCFALLLHKTTFGRSIYAMGNNITAWRFSGIQVDKIKVIVFTLTGVMAAVTAIFLNLTDGEYTAQCSNGL